jgi:hypothetical protein
MRHLYAALGKFDDEQFFESWRTSIRRGLRRSQLSTSYLRDARDVESSRTKTRSWNANSGCSEAAFMRSKHC